MAEDLFSDLQNQNDILADNLDVIRQVNDEIREQLNLSKKLSGLAKLSADQYRNINLTNRQFADLNKKLIDQISQRESLTRKNLDIQKDISKLALLTSSYETELAQIIERESRARGENKKILTAIKNGLNEQIILSRVLQDSLNTELNISNKIGKSFGVAGNILKGVSGIAKKIGIDIDDILKASTEQIARLEAEGKLRDGMAGKLQGLAVIAKNVGVALLKSFNDPLILGGIILKQIISSFKMLDDLAGQTSKNLGISYAEATKLNSQFTQIASTSDNIFITTKSLGQAFNDINNTLGTNGELSADLLINFTKLTKQAGYTVEAATTLSKLSLVNGKQIDVITKQYLGQIKVLNIRNGLAVNEKALLNDINNISQGTLATFAQHPQKLAEAAFEAKKLGLSLQVLEGISSSLLNIESSISAEFESEVLTGRMLNLERARYYALTNDIAGLSKELSAQGITQNKFAALNVIQQESVAKAMGLSRDELGKMLIDQEAISRIGARDIVDLKRKYELVKGTAEEQAFLNKLGDDAYAKQLASVTVQERFTQSVEKLKELFVGLITPLMPLVDVLSNMSGLISGMVSSFLVFKGYQLAVLAVSKIQTGLMAVQSGLAMGMMATEGRRNILVAARQSLLGGELAKAIGIAAAYAIANPLQAAVGLALAAGVAALVMSQIPKINDGTIDSDGGLVVSGPKGSIKLDKDDTFVGNKNGIVAGTDLGINNNTESNITNNNNFTTNRISNDGGITVLANSLGTKLDTLINEVKIMASELKRGMTVNLDGNKVSQEIQTPLAINTRRI